MKRPKPELRHIVQLLQAYLDREKITQQELGKRLGISPEKAAVASGWLRGINAPSPAYRAPLAALLKVDEAELMRHDQSKALVRKAPAEAQARALVAHLQAPLPAAQVMPPRKQHDVLGYVVTADGQAEVRLLARGPHARMAAVFRMLLDAGLVPGGEEEEPL